MVSMVTGDDCHAPGSPESGVAAGVELGKVENVGRIYSGINLPSLSATLHSTC